MENPTCGKRNCDQLQATVDERVASHSRVLSDAQEQKRARCAVGKGAKLKLEVEVGRRQRLLTRAPCRPCLDRLRQAYARPGLPLATLRPRPRLLLPRSPFQSDCEPPVALWLEAGPTPAAPPLYHLVIFGPVIAPASRKLGASSGQLARIRNPLNRLPLRASPTP
jgi:hypothetical protein